MIKLIATDMDNSLLGEGYILEESFFDIFEKLKEKNIKLLAASGRQGASMMETFKHEKDNIIFVYENGSCASLNGEILYKSVIDNEIVQEFIRIGRENNLDILLGAKDTAYIESRNPAFIDKASNFFANLEIVDDLTKVNDEIIKCNVCDLDGIWDHFHNIIEPNFGDKLQLATSMGFWIHLVNKGITKGYAVKMIQEKLGIKGSEMMTFGDDDGDIEMIELADEYAFAMDNARDEIKEHAKHIAPAYNKNGVLETIKKIIIDGETL